MENFSEWVNSPETIRVEHSALILGLRVTLDALERIPNAVPIRLSVEMLYRPFTQYFHQVLDQIEFAMPVPEIVIRAEIVMRGTESYRRMVIIPLSLVSSPDFVEERLRTFLFDKEAEDFKVLE